MVTFPERDGHDRAGVGCEHHLRHFDAWQGHSREPDDDISLPASSESWNSAELPHRAPRPPTDVRLYDVNTHPARCGKRGA